MIDLYLLLLAALLTVKYSGRVIYLIVALVLAGIAWVMVGIWPNPYKASDSLGEQRPVPKFYFYRAYGGLALQVKGRYKTIFIWPDKLYNYKQAWKNLLEAFFYNG